MQVNEGARVSTLTPVRTAQSRIARAVLRGPFRLFSDDGRDITPGSTLRQAILAVLISSPRQIRSRKSLQDLFWGEISPARASANLRTAIYLLRKDLAVLGPDILRTDRQTVSLAPDQIITADAAPAGPGFLEGMDLALDGCGVFEDWLRDMRLADDDGPRVLDPVPSSTLTRIQIVVPHVALGLLPPVHAGLSKADLHFAEGFVDNVVHYVSQTTTMDVHDLRGVDSQIVPLPISSGKGATHWLQAVAERQGPRISLRLRLVEGGSRRLIWLSDTVIGRAGDTTEIGYAMGETILDRLASQSEIANAPDLFPISALAAMFSLDAQMITRTEAQLDMMLGEGGSCILECLRVFAQIFKVHEGIGPSSGFDTAKLCDRLSEMRTSDPLLPLCQSLAGYALHMLADDQETAFHLVEAAYDRAPHLAINLDHLAVMRLMRGDIDGAAAALQKCLRAGAFSPWRYTYEVTGAMVCMARGDFRQSLYHANQALFRQPRYLGALRYAMAGLAVSGKPEDAQRMKARIKSLRPDHDLSAWADGLMRRAPTHLSKTLISGLRDSAIL